MDSNSNSYDLLWPKLELESENDSPRREPRLNWTSENTIKLIKILEKDCKELWDVKNPLNKDRCARQERLEYLADQFGTTSEEISRKIHNLRTQLNNELRKIKRRSSAAASSGDPSGVGGSGWEYFDALSFLTRTPAANGDSLTFPGDPLDCVEGVNLELAEFQAKEEEEFGAAVARTQQQSAVVTPAPTPTVRSKPKKRVARPAGPANLMWLTDEAEPRLEPGIRPDECQIFGDFVASELRMLRSQESRKTLKRMIQKAILQVADEEDMKIHCKGT